MVKSCTSDQACVQRSENDAGTNDGDSLVVKTTKHNQKNSVETDQGQVYFLPIYQGFNCKSSPYLKTLLTQMSIVRVDRLVRLLHGWTGKGLSLYHRKGFHPTSRRPWRYIDQWPKRWKCVFLHWELSEEIFYRYDHINNSRQSTLPSLNPYRIFRSMCGFSFFLSYTQQLPWKERNDPLRTGLKFQISMLKYKLSLTIVKNSHWN